jgi:hypothetical protein
MSSNLSNSVDLAGSSTFRDVVTAAMVEHAAAMIPASPSTPSEHLAARVVYDAASVATSFVRLAADDPAVSTAGRSSFDPDDVRRVVAEKWATVATVVPNLGS